MLGKLSKFLTVYTLFDMLENASVIVGEIVVLVIGQGAVHDFKQLFLA